ncbi:MAG: UDP-N-acetylmuramate dehydrogenase [Oscillospiraceae bacterium]|nr:UDP-N-acetylmuramate dehydrogenase [Oscillospiraceae bacterium]
MYNNIKRLALKLGCKVFIDEPMSKHTTFKIGGPADLFIKIFNMDSLRIILEEIANNNLNYFVLGKGSNLLVSDFGFRGIILKLGGNFSAVKKTDDTKLQCGSSASLAKACVFALKNNLSGLEFAWGIPGTCGGAAYMNAGAYGSDMSSIITNCVSIDKKGRVKNTKAKDLKFSYRKSVFFENDDIILDISVKLVPGDKDKIKSQMHEYISRRKLKQPLDFPNAGSVFKRPQNNYAGTLIEKCGLKGKRIGNAMVSNKHAGFIVNAGNATCKDVTDLIKFVQNDVFNKTGVFLEKEVIILGEKIWAMSQNN